MDVDVAFQKGFWKERALRVWRLNNGKDFRSISLWLVAADGLKLRYSRILLKGNFFVPEWQHGGKNMDVDVAFQKIFWERKGKFNYID
ncbi:hypothetical protein CEXT_703901 [Caerostris extrusa]|uniref:Uncharacterized protein n=1 Tax=Caerostris extrusa TaxID=172846 RepID=A0AAV4PG12_CAEEX|nr:hypothetical protein CEXT_703901 [Caerostris extrusa]